MRPLTIVLIVVTLLANATIAHAATSVVYATNLSDPPTLRCRPASEQMLAACAIFLPIGESVNPDKISGDTVRWELRPEVFGPKDQPQKEQSVVFVKARTDAASIETTVYLTTDAVDGVYRVLLIADPSAPAFSEVHFTHKLTNAQRVVDEQNAESARAQQQANAVAAASAARELAGERAALEALVDKPCLQRLYADRFHWDLKSSLAPAAVFVDDEHHTCVELPAAMQITPVPYLGNNRLARQRVRNADNMIIIDGEQASFTLKHGSDSLQINYHE